MKHALYPALLVSVLSCSSVEPADRSQRDSVESSVAAGVELSQGVSLRASSCTRVGDVYEMTHVEVDSANGESFTASTGMIASSGTDWEVTLSDVSLAGGGTTKTIVLRSPKQAGALAN